MKFYGEIINDDDIVTKDYVNSTLANMADVFWCTYDTTTAAELETAYQNGKICCTKYFGRTYTLYRRTAARRYDFICVYPNDNALYTLSCTSNDAWTSSIKYIAPEDSPVFTGTPEAPTATSGTNTDQIATTAFVQNAINTTTPPIQSAGIWSYRLYDNGYFEAWGYDTPYLSESDFSQDGSLYTTIEQEIAIPYSAMGITPADTSIHSSLTGKTSASWVSSCREVSSSGDNYIKYKITATAPTTGLSGVVELYLFGAYQI